ncbi:MAG: PLP-dependent aspartate aminotransferase family protein [Actinomycetota bacterium]|nr:aminotransferase class I/II-fold pyridoxal phosphate-dependent enzyme [Actinomycetota bacterium]
MTDRGFTTRAVNAWREIEHAAGSSPASPPLYQSATWIFDDMEHFASVGQTKIEGGYLYTRWGNPTTDAVARVIATLEGAEATACFSSGMAAIFGTVFSSVESGDHVVAATQLYGGTHGLFGHVLPRMGVAVTKLDVHDHAGIERAFTGRTRVLYCETLGNPALDVADLDTLSAIARAHGALLVVDATFTPPSILRPIEHGVDLVLHSATKYLSGHSDVTGGVVSGRAAGIARIRSFGIDLGAVLSPFESWLLGRGVQTLALRSDRICDSALQIARALESHPNVARVLYPGLESHPDHDLAKRLLGDRFGGMIAFDVGSAERGRRLLERVKVCAPAASLGGTKTLIVHPVSITHTQLSPDERRAAGITDGMIRLSVGIEDVMDLIADLEQALT